MKLNNIYFLFFALIALVGTFSSCEEDPMVDRITKPGALPDISEVTSGFFNFNDPSSAKVGFTLNTKGTPVSSVDIYKSLNGGDAVMHSTVSSFPATVEIGLTDALSGSGVSIDDLEVGDVFTFSFVSKTADGRDLRSGESFEAPVSCPSDLAGGYTSVASGTSTDGCCTDPISGFNSSATLTALGDGKYTLSDFSGGLYLEWYDVYGIASTEDTPCTLQDVCGQLTIIDTTEPFGTDVTGTGSVDAATGVITFSWVNGYADQGTVVLTPQ